MTGHISQHTYSQMQFVFRHKMNIDSQYIIFQCIAKLSEVKSQFIDCCKNSCIAYTSKYVHFQSCPFCQEARFNQVSKPHQQFMYLLLILQLQGYFQSMQIIQILSYHVDYDLGKGEVCDVFNGNLYQELLCCRVVVDREELSHRYFSDS